MIKLEHINKTFDTASGNVHAVQDVSLEIQDGEIFGVIGFSGAGKSTLIRCINLLERPTSGSIQIDGIELTTLDEKQLREMRTKIGMIFQHFNLMRSRTVYENIEFPLKKGNRSKGPCSCSSFLCHRISTPAEQDYSVLYAIRTP